MSADDKLGQERTPEGEHSPTLQTKQNDDEPTGTPVKPYSDVHIPAPPKALQDSEPAGTPVKPYSDVHIPAPPKALQDSEPEKPSDEYVSGEGGA